MNPRLLTAFPRNGEAKYVAVFDMFYILGSVPFKVEYDTLKEKYSIRLIRPLQIIICIRAFLQFILLIFTCRLGAPPGMGTTGPLKVFYISILVGTQVTSIIYFWTLLSKKNQQIIAEICNLIKYESLSQQIADDDRKNSSSIRPQQCWVALHFIITIIIVMWIIVSNELANGLESKLRAVWYLIILADKSIPVSNMDGDGTRNLEEDFFLWKKGISVVIMLAQWDTYFSLECAILLLFFTAKTLKTSSIHFYKCLGVLQSFCVISSDEIFSCMHKLRKLFAFASKSMRWLTLTLVITESVNACLGIIWAFLNTNDGATMYIMLVQLVYLSWFFLLSAKASKQLNHIHKRINSNYTNCYRYNASSNSLQKFLMIHEITSGSIGMDSIDIFTITYGFIISLVINVLSNATIILQSLDSLKEWVSSGL